MTLNFVNLLFNFAPYSDDVLIINHFLHPYLIDFFKDLEGSILIISDTSGDYSKEFGKSLPDNVIIIEEDIDFCYLIQQSDCFIRYTSTDGDSISVMESLFFKTSVIATNCIRRHEACILCEYGDMESLAIAVKNFNERS